MRGHGWNFDAARRKRTKALKLKSMAGRAAQVTDDHARQHLKAILSSRPWRSEIQDTWPLEICPEIWPGGGKSKPLKPVDPEDMPF